jgi:tetratricopeptide (TPR) repeat protein
MQIIQPHGLALKAIRVLVLSGVATYWPFAFCAQQPASDASTAPAAQNAPAQSDYQVTHEDVGDSMLVHRRYQEALDEYKKAPADSSDVWDKMGIAYQMLTDLKGAARCYGESIRLKPDNELALNNLGTVYDLQGDFRKAEVLYRKAFQINPTSARIAMNLGTNLMFQNRFSEGSGMYKLALTLDKDAFEEFHGPVTSSGTPLQQRGAMNYYKAMRCAEAGMNDQAIHYLRDAVGEGFISAARLALDNSFAALRNNPKFVRLIAEETK